MASSEVMALLKYALSIDQQKARLRVLAFDVMSLVATTSTGSDVLESSGLLDTAISFLTSTDIYLSKSVATFVLDVSNLLEL